jgi:hypothetical protein
MSSTITLSGDWLISLGNRRQTKGTGNLGTYATGGIAVTANQVGLGVLESLSVRPAGGYVFEYVPSTAKIKAYWTGATTSAVLAEVDTSTNLSSITFTFLAEGY